ncbi:MAG: hypothetical protein ABSG65_16210 [Bryobacteraceae bacterium]
MPKGTYRILRSKVHKNPNPMVLNRGEAGRTTSRQIVDYLLCEECEGRFSRLGEDWLLKYCYREHKFLLREILQQNRPYSDGEISVYPAARILDIDTTRLIYFAMSVFWRAGVHSWPWEGEDVQIELGPYLEPIRRFLMGEGGFPSNMALFVRVPAIDQLLQTSFPPESRNHDGAHSHHFAMPGILFMLVVGKRGLEGSDTASTAPGPERYIYIYKSMDEADLANAVDLVKASRQRVPRP